MLSILGFEPPPSRPSAHFYSGTRQQTDSETPAESRSNIRSHMKAKPWQLDQIPRRIASTLGLRDLVIANADRRDLKAVSSLFAEATREQTWLSQKAIATELNATSREALRGVLVSESHIAIVARQARQVLGACLAWDDGGGLTWIATIAVVPHVRRQGLARALIAEVARRAVHRLSHRLWCMTFVENSPANTMLSSLGFTRNSLLTRHAYEFSCYLWHKDVIP